MNRRDLLKGAVGLLVYNSLPPVLRPLGASPWSAIAGLNTHQFVVGQAMALLAQDPGVPMNTFPSTAQIQSQDWVEVGSGGLSGPGPDCPGRSDYSWHYYNPRLLRGRAPEKVAEYFGTMVGQRMRGEDSSHDTAWAAHFLADMFVPYHVVGMTIDDAHHLNRIRRFVLDEDLCGNWEMLYSPSGWGEAPAGWGGFHDHSENLQWFCRNFLPGNPERVDWFDPWYWNGYVTRFPQTRYGSSSHAVWETMAQAAQGFRGESQRIQGRSWYDPLWMNVKPGFGGNPWEAQARAVRTFAEKCAARTRDRSVAIFTNPTLGMAMAVRGVLTLYRASTTALRLSATAEALSNGGYRIIGHVQNASDRAHVTAADVKLSVQGPRGPSESTLRVGGAIPPNHTGFVSWDISQGEALRCSMEVSAEVFGCPDLGYQRFDFSTQGTQLQEPAPEEVSEGPVDPAILMTWDGEWQVAAEAEYEGRTVEIDEGWVMEIRVNGLTFRARWISGPAAMGNDPAIEEYSVTNGGRCLHFLERNPSGPEYYEGRICFEGGWNTFSGWLSSNIYPGLKIDLTGRRLIR